MNGARNGIMSMELLLLGGNIYTVDRNFSRASVLAVRGNEIVYVGNDRAAGAALLSAGARVVELDGRTVVPGFIDSHMHFLTQGRHLLELDLFGKSKDEILEMVAQEAARLAPEQWIIGRGWDHESWHRKEWPTCRELEAVAPRHPVALTRADAHSMWANSLAMQAAGLDRNSPQPVGGEILKTADGDLLGILIDTPMHKVWGAMPPLTPEQMDDSCRRAQQAFFSYGITSLGDAWEGMRDVESLQNAYARGLLKIRIYGMMASANLKGEPYFKEEFRPIMGQFGERFTMRAFKAVLDGSLGSRSAWLSRDYADRPGHRGNGRYSDDELYQMLLPPVRNGFQICSHAIGDAAVLQGVRVMERVLRELPDTDHRHRIEHFQIASPETVRRAVNLGLVPAMQTQHALADRHMAEARLDADLLAASYPWRKVLDSGGIIANGSDSPMDAMNPFAGFYAAVSRKDFSLLLPQERRNLALSREEALKSYTIWAARAEFAEGRKGSLEEGKLGDFAVLDRDIMTCPEEDIPETAVLMTVLGGEVVHEETERSRP